MIAVVMSLFLTILALLFALYRAYERIAELEAYIYDIQHL